LPEFIYGTELDYDAETGEIRSISRVRAGYGKVAAVEEIATRHSSAIHALFKFLRPAAP
jgi:hypothetical protein